MTWTKVVGFFPGNPMVTLDLILPIIFKVISRSSPLIQMESHTFDAGKERKILRSNMFFISDKKKIDQWLPMYRTKHLLTVF